MESSNDSNSNPLPPVIQVEKSEKKEIEELKNKLKLLELDIGSLKSLRNDMKKDKLKNEDREF